MLSICSQFADDFDITFNSKKTVCMKFGENINHYEKVHLNGKIISWVEKIRHLGNYLDTTLIDEIDCRSKISAFIGYVNKLNVNFGHLRLHVISNLFKSYCCSFYGSQMWKLDSLHFNKVCTAWNIGVRRTLNLPFTSHRYFLGPIMRQPHIRFQLYKRCVRFLFGMTKCNNVIVKSCLNNAAHNANTPLGYNIAFFRSTYGFNVLHSNVRKCLNSIVSPVLSNDQSININHLHTLLSVRSGFNHIPAFTKKDINTLIHGLTTG